MNLNVTLRSDKSLFYVGGVFVTCFILLCMFPLPALVLLKKLLFSTKPLPALVCLHEVLFSTKLNISRLMLTSHATLVSLLAGELMKVCTPVILKRT